MDVSFDTANKETSTPAANQSCEGLKCYMVLEEIEKRVIGSICFLAGPITLMENVLVLGVIATSISLRRRPSYMFIASLALADVFASCFFTTSFLDFHLFHRSDRPNAYLFKLGGVTMAFTASVGSLLLTALDRYLCIHQASSYKLLLTRRRALLSLLVLWCSTIIISFLPLMGWQCHTGFTPPCSRLFPYISRSYLACWTGFTLMLLALILAAYTLILWKAHRHESSMASFQVAAGTGQARMRMDIRLARTFGLILLILVVCWLPALSFMLVDVSTVLTRSEQRAFAFCSTFCLLNSTVNPLLYALRCRDLRLALMHSLQRLWEIGRCKKSQRSGVTAREDNCSEFSDNKMPQVEATELDSISKIVENQPDVK